MRGNIENVVEQSILAAQSLYLVGYRRVVQSHRQLEFEADLEGRAMTGLAFHGVVQHVLPPGEERAVKVDFAIGIGVPPTNEVRAALPVERRFTETDRHASILERSLATLAIERDTNVQSLSDVAFYGAVKPPDGDVASCRSDDAWSLLLLDRTLSPLRAAVRAGDAGRIPLQPVLYFDPFESVLTGKESQRFLEAQVRALDNIRKRYEEHNAGRAVDLAASARHYNLANERVYTIKQRIQARQFTAIPKPYLAYLPRIGQQSMPLPK